MNDLRPSFHSFLHSVYFFSGTVAVVPSKEISIMELCRNGNERYANRPTELG